MSILDELPDPEDVWPTAYNAALRDCLQKMVTESAGRIADGLGFRNTAADTGACIRARPPSYAVLRQMQDALFNAQSFAASIYARMSLPEPIIIDRTLVDAGARSISP